jgi:hypothetical protein
MRAEASPIPSVNLAEPHCGFMSGQLRTCDSHRTLLMAMSARPDQGDLLEGPSLQAPSFEEWLMAERPRLQELAVEFQPPANHTSTGQRGTVQPELNVRTELQPF